jgi:hypothetical protein
VAQQLRELHGNVAAVARACGVGRTAVCNFVRRRPQLQGVLKECREAMKDNAESALYRAVLAGEAWAVCFYLKTQAKDRGYVERAEIDPVRPLTVKLVRDGNFYSNADRLHQLADDNGEAP